VGIVAGIALALAVLQLGRLQLALPAVIKAALRRREFFWPTSRWWTSGPGSGSGRSIDPLASPGGENVRPDLFIPVAEESGLIQRITQRVADLLAQDAAGFFRRHESFHIAINLSSIDLHSDRTGPALRRLAEATGAGAGNLMVEVTERGFTGSESRSRGLARTACGGHQGGHRRLRYRLLESGRTCRTSKVDMLKIDKSFVDTLTRAQPG